MIGQQEEQAVPPSDRGAERARLDAELQIDATWLLHLQGVKQRIKIKIVEARIRFGLKLEARLAITDEGEKDAYVIAMASAWGFSKQTANDNRWYAKLNQNDQGSSVEQLAELTVAEVRHRYRSQLQDIERVMSIAEQRKADAIDNAVQVALLIKTGLRQHDLRKLHRLQQQGLKYEAYEDWIAGSIIRRETPLSREEQGRGLSKLMLDSGAYVESTRGIQIDIDEYCDLLLANPWISIYASLDKIVQADPEDGAYISHRNFRHMRDCGLNPIPVFHAGESFTWLEKYIHVEACDYIALGGVAKNTLTWNWAFFDECFEIIEESGRTIKTHAFGVGEEETLIHYPFASADATSWILRSQKFGMTDISRLGDRSWRGSLDDGRLAAARTYLEALDAHRLESQIREQREFDFYLALRPENPWWLPSLWTAGHRNALISFHQTFDPALTKQFIDEPLLFLQRQRYNQRLELLEEMKNRYTGRMSEWRSL